MQQAGKFFIIAGVFLIIIGVVVYFFGNKLNFIGKLPGDIRIEKENFKLYIPITTMIIFSILVGLIVRIYQFFK
jgi:hypothetical protein